MKKKDKKIKAPETLCKYKIEVFLKKNNKVSFFLKSADKLLRKLRFPYFALE